nr:CHAP domain-containing protein [uncultured Oscillibacter sp.]
MTRDGVVLENQTTGEEINISDREAEQDFTPAGATGRAEKVLERADQAQERRSMKKAAKQAGQVEADTDPRSSARLQFSEKERSTPELKKYIRKSDRRADRLDAARAAIPKETVKIKEKVFDGASGRAKTRVRRETRDKPPPVMKPNPASRPVQEVLLFTHGKIHEVEHENVGVEGGHKGEELAERQAGRAVRGAIRRRRMKPYRELSKAERLAEKANIEYFHQKTLHDNPQLAQAAKSGSKAAKEAVKESERLASFAVRHWKGCLVALALLIMVSFLMGGLQSCSSIIGGFGSGFTATSYLSDDADLIAVENAYVGMENDLQRQIDSIPSTYPGYDEYRYDLDEIMHNPHELASFLTSILPRYTLAEVQAELQRVFSKQYTLTTTTTVEVRYRTETRTDSDGSTYTVQVPYNYYILNVKLTARSIASIAPELLTPEQLEMFNIYLETSGNNPLVFGGGSYDISASEDISGVHFVDGARPGNTAVVDIAKSQVGNVNGQPYWSWYGFDSRVEWCACFVSWCYNQMGLTEPKFAGCTSGGMAWFQSRGQWANRGYSDIAPGDAIFFDWDNSGNADHVGIVIGTDGTNVYTVEGNSGNACKIKSYPLNSSVIRGYGLMNWD